MRLTSDNALKLVSVALAEGSSAGLRLSVAVVDAGGFLMAFGRADGAHPYTAEVAQGKAYAVVFMGRTSEQLRTFATDRPQMFDAVKSLGMRTVIPSPGGLPVLDGAIGVSGASDPAQDVQIAEAAIATLDAGPR